MINPTRASSVSGTSILMIGGYTFYSSTCRFTLTGHFSLILLNYRYFSNTDILKIGLSLLCCILHSIYYIFPAKILLFFCVFIKPVNQSNSNTNRIVKSQPPWHDWNDGNHLITSSQRNNKCY